MHQHQIKDLLDLPNLGQDQCERNLIELGSDLI